MTNREWLESLSDEEYVRELNSCHRCDECELTGECDSQSCDRQFVRWLQSRHVEENNK